MTNAATLQALQSAARLLQAGRIAEAEQALLALTRAQPSNSDALALLGLAAAQRGDNERAASLMAQSLAIAPDHGATLSNYARVLRKLERWNEAVDVLSRLLKLRPDHNAARKERAAALDKLARPAEALADLDTAISPFDGDLQNLVLRAKLRFQAHRAADAIADYDRVLALDPHDWQSLNNRGIALDQLERYTEALASYDAALALQPNNDDVLHNRGATLICLKRFEEAFPLFERLTQSDPGRADNWSCHGVALASLGRISEAIASFDRALALDEKSLRALNGKGMALTALGHLDEGLVQYGKALALYPHDAMTHGNTAFALLVKGDLTKGFAEYEWRRRDGPIGQSQRQFTAPEWQGEDLAGKTLLLHPEQGLGDVVHFARFVPLLEARGARVVLEVPPPLESLCRTLSPTVQVIRSGERPPPFDMHAPLMSLAHKLRIELSTIPAAVPYLHANEAKREAWRRRLAPLKTPRVGICWSGSVIHRNDRARSIPFADFAKALALPEISFVSLQREVRESDTTALAAQANVTALMEHVSDFSDTADLIAELDLVVTVDTSVAHVAGALAKPVWILVSFTPDWRWLTARADSPWYPTARLFRQRTIGAWGPVLDSVRNELARRFDR